MKKFLLLLVCLALMLSALVTFAEGEAYMSIFDANFDGWYPRSTGGAELYIDEGSIEIPVRAQDLNSHGRG